ncbi:MAG: hypothetical protein OJF61_000898 [Rhodanobacteraceae bacterium]|nr:MAG: hypothetical protein OJF61_000898 [Rhodanobacteraceae bacterium]
MPESLHRARTLAGGQPRLRGAERHCAQPIRFMRDDGIYISVIPAMDWPGSSTMEGKATGFRPSPE